MIVAELGNRTREWDAFVRTADEGSPFHLTTWKRAVEETFGLRAHYLMASRGHGIEGVLPLFEARGLLGRRALISAPYAVYGGICAVSQPARQVLAEAATELGRRRGAAYIELRQRHDQGLGLPTKTLYVTFARTISKDEEENVLAIPRKQRRMTRQGAKYGLRSEIGRDHFDAFYAVYAESVRNLGTPVFPRRFLRSVLDLFEDECELLTIWRDGRVVAGVLTLLFEDQALPYYGGSRRDAWPYAVNDFMYWRLMCHVARAGYRTFDFGRSREGVGSYHFKRHWGFEPVPLPYQYILLDAQMIPNLSPSNPGFRLATDLWKRLPLPLANILGPLITRYLP